MFSTLRIYLNSFEELITERFFVQNKQTKNNNFILDFYHTDVDSVLLALKHWNHLKRIWANLRKHFDRTLSTNHTNTTVRVGVFSRCFLGYVFIHTMTVRESAAQCAPVTVHATRWQYRWDDHHVSGSFYSLWSGDWNNRDPEMKSGTFIHINLEIIR